MSTFFQIYLGLGLAAASGFRIFVPLLFVSLASYLGNIDLATPFAWLGTFPAVVALSVATFVEISAYYIPWVDNMLDVIAGPLAVVAGVLVMASTIDDVDPMAKWALAIIAGGGAAGIMQSFTTVLRGTSAVTTGGIGNPIVSTLETVSSMMLSIMSLIFPIFSVVIVFVLIVFVIKNIRGRRRDEVIYK